MVGEIDEALELLKVSGPEYGGGFPNHGPMAAAPHVALAFVRALLHNHDAPRRRGCEASRLSSFRSSFKAGRKPMTEEHPSPEGILQLGFGFWASKTLLSAVELGVFTELAKEPLSAETLRKRLGLHSRSAHDFFDALVALGMLRRDGETYANNPATDLFLDRNKPSFIGGILEMANARLYSFWASLTEGLRTGQPQNEAKSGARTRTLIIKALSAVGLSELKESSLNIKCTPQEIRCEAHFYVI